MSTETPVVSQSTQAESTPAAPAAPSTDWSSFKITDEQFRAAGFSDADLKQSAEPVSATTTPAATPAPAPAPVAEPPKVDENALNLDLLKDPESPTAAVVPSAAAPSLTPDQQAVLRLMPNADMAAMGAQGLQVINNFIRGDLPQMFQALQQVNPQAFATLQEQLYKSLMEQYVDRYIAENDPNSNPMLTSLQRQLAQVQQERAQEKQAQTNWQQQQQHAQRLQAVEGEVTRLFDLVKFTDANGFDEADRDFVRKAIRHDLATNRPALEQAWSGNLTALRPIFRSQVNAYVERDRARAEKLRATAQKQQNDKKPPLQAAGVGTTATSTAKGRDAFFDQAAAFVREHQ